MATTKERLDALEASFALMREDTNRTSGALEKQGEALEEQRESIANITRLLEQLAGARNVGPTSNGDPTPTMEGPTPPNGDRNNDESRIPPFEEEEASGNSNRTWTKKVEMPTFTGEDPFGWFTRAEKFFETQGVPETERIRLAFMSMEGHSLHWFRVLKKRKKNLCWAELVKEMVKRFGDRAQGSVHERLKTLQQTGTVDEYIQEFEILVAQMAIEDEEILLGYFIGGLKPAIRHRVRTLNPREVYQAMEVALNVEIEVREAEGTRGNDGRQGSNRFGSNSSGSGNFGPAGPNLTTGSTKPNGPNTGPNGNRTPSIRTGATSSNSSRNHNSVAGGRDRGIRELPYEEFIRRREAGKCYKCGLDFSPNHQCKYKSLRLTILAEDEGNWDGEEGDPIEEVDIPEELVSDEGEMKWMNLSLTSMCRITEGTEGIEERMAIEEIKVPEEWVIAKGEVKWKDYPLEGDYCETVGSPQLQLPQFNLGDKVVSPPGGIDTVEKTEDFEIGGPRPLRIYTKKNRD